MAATNNHGPTLQIFLLNPPVILYNSTRPTKMKRRRDSAERNEDLYAAEDIRFTVKNMRYAILLGWLGEGKGITVKSLQRLCKHEVNSVTMLGDDRELEWHLLKKGLRLRYPSGKTLRTCLCN